MKERLSRTGLIALALLTSCASGVRLVTDANERVEKPGLSILPPRGEHWYLVEAGSSAVVLTKVVPGRKPNTIVALAFVRDLGEPRFTTPKVFRDWIHELEQKVEPGMRLLSARHDLDPSGGPWRVRFSLRLEDRRVPGHGSQPFICEAHGYHDIHPRWPRYFVSVGVTQRTADGTQPLPIDSEVQPFLDSFRFSGEPLVGVSPVD